MFLCTAVIFLLTGDWIVRCRLAFAPAHMLFRTMSINLSPGPEKVFHFLTTQGEFADLLRGFIPSHFYFYSPRLYHYARYKHHNHSPYHIRYHTYSWQIAKLYFVVCRMTVDGYFSCCLHNTCFRSSFVTVSKSCKIIISISKTTKIAPFSPSVIFCTGTVALYTL